MCIEVKRNQESQIENTNRSQIEAKQNTNRRPQLKKNRQIEDVRNLFRLK